MSGSSQTWPCPPPSHISAHPNPTQTTQHTPALCCIEGRPFLFTLWAVLLLRNPLPEMTIFYVFFTAQVRFPSERGEELTLSSGILWTIPSEWAGAVRKGCSECPEPQPHLPSVPPAGAAQTHWAHAAILRSPQGRSWGGHFPSQFVKGAWTMEGAPSETAPQPCR